MICNKVDNVYKKKTIKNQAKTQKAIECFNPEALQTPVMLSHSQTHAQAVRSKLGVSSTLPATPNTAW